MGLKDIKNIKIEYTHPSVKIIVPNRGYFKLCERKVYIEYYCPVKRE